MKQVTDYSVHDNHTGSSGTPYKLSKDVEDTQDFKNQKKYAKQLIKEKILKRPGLFLSTLRPWKIIQMQCCSFQITVLNQDNAKTQ